MKTFDAAPHVVAPIAVVIGCPDPRCVVPLEEFLYSEKKLKKEQYIFLAHLGGILHAINPLSETFHALSLRDTIRFCFEEIPSIKQCILVNHERCLRYDAVAEKMGRGSFLHGSHTMVMRQKRDLTLVKKEVIPKIVPRQVSIEAWMMRYHKDKAHKDKVVFEEMK